MGCAGSKDTAAVPDRATSPQVHAADGSTKPWKQNQVVPLPQGSQAAGAQVASFRKPPLSAFGSGSGKDAASNLDQGPADVLADLRDLCSAKVQGAELAPLAGRLHDVLKLHLSNALRSHALPKHADLLLEVMARAVECCNGILQPVLAHFTRVLSNRQAGSTWAEAVTWEQMEFVDLLGLLEDACMAVYDQGVMEVGRPVSALMDVLHELRQHCEAHHIALPAAASQVSALDELMGTVGIIFFRKVVLETADSAAAKLEQYSQLQEQMGWSDAQLASCTGAEARAMLAYLNQVSAAGEKRANVTVRRSSAFWDALECGVRDGLPPPAATAPMSHKYFPSFVDEMAQPGGGGGAAHGRRPVVEAGEGHGPRKEFFALAGQDMAGMAPAQAAAAAAAAGGSGKHASPPVSTAASGGSGALDVGEGAGGGGGAGGGAEAAAAPEAAPGSGAAQQQQQQQQQRRPPLFVFNRTAGFFWYNTALPDSPDARRAYAFAGWLLGQSLLNRAPLGLALPPVLFQALLDGPDAFRPTLDTLAAFDPGAANGVRNVLALPPEQLGAMLELEGLPGSWSAEQYAAHAVAQVLVEGVAWQSAGLAAGFFAAVDRRLLRAWRLGPAALAALAAGAAAAAAAGAEGGAPADLSAAFRVSLDEELSGASALLVELLWEVLAAWPPERRLRFVEFVTGTSRLPLPGAELLRIQAPFVAMGAAEHRSTLGMLPQAHTCDNLLELPNYWESLLAVRGVRGGPAAVARGAAALSGEQLAELRAEVRRILDERLEMAVCNFQGYGLDERAGGRGGGGGGGDDDEDADGGDDRGDQGAGRGGDLRAAPDHEAPGTPAALTADSLASLARASATSSMLQSAHFLSATPASPVLPPRSPHQRSALGATATTHLRVPTVPASPAGPSPPPLSRHDTAQGAAGAAPQLTEAERHASLMARFSMEPPPRDGSGGGALVIRQPSAESDSDQDVFR